MSAVTGFLCHVMKGNAQGGNPLQYSCLLQGGAVLIPLSPSREPRAKEQEAPQQEPEQIHPVHFLLLSFLALHAFSAEPPVTRILMSAL